jgi:hypothetical protein
MREVGIILIAAFAIDRIVTGLFFLLSYNTELRMILDPNSIEDPEAKESGAKLYRLIYAVCAGYLGIVIVAGVMGIRLSKIAGLELDPNAGPVMGSMLDILVTGLLLVGGADRLADALKLYGDKDSKPQAPIEITGRVVLEQGAAKIERAGH